MATKIGRLQRKVYEIGMIGSLAHNLARYEVMDSGAYSASEFLFAVRGYMADRKVEPAQINSWMKLVEAQAANEHMYFLRNKQYANTAGGTAISIDALIGHILDQLGYEGGER